MLTTSDLDGIALARLDDARALLQASRYDGAVYLCGYVIEIALKARICKTLGWSGYPENRTEFGKYSSFRTHDLEVLLHLSGSEQVVGKGKHWADWSVVVSWDPNARYKPTGENDRTDAENMIESAGRLLKVL